MEWALVELQGRIEQQLDIEPGALLPVGTLQLSPVVRKHEMGHAVMQQDCGMRHVWACI